MFRGRDLQGIPGRLWLTGALFAAFVTSFAVYVYWEKQIDRANETRQLSFRLADQLRQSSDDLTRMVRTFVVTGNPIYRQAYQDILDIRDGVRLEPEGYEAAYWDVVLLNPDYPRSPPGPGVSLLEQMRRAGFTGEEFQKLAEAKAKSDGLTSREFEAMRLAEAGGPPADRMAAIQMVHDAVYHQAKAAIMTPINDFYVLVERRTLAMVRHAETVALVLRLTFIAFTMGAVVFLWRTYAESRAILGGSVQEVHAQITRIGQGDFSLAAPKAAGAGNSVLAGLARTAEQLKALEADRARNTAEVQEMNHQLLRSNADLEQFAYVASHDLKTPLRNIVSYTQLLERRYRGVMGPDADDFIGFIVENTKKMTQLISDLLEYARVSRQDEVLEPIAAAEAVAQAMGNLKADLDAARAEIAIGDLPPVMAVGIHLVSLFQNLLENSLKYRSPSRPARIAISAERTLPDWWRFAVADNGIGIDPAYHDKVFEIFQRLNPAGETMGTGIGLTLCRRIVHRFGGSIWLDSEAGKGTTVFFTLRAG